MKVVYPTVIRRNLIIDVDTLIEGADIRGKLLVTAPHAALRDSRVNAGSRSWFERQSLRWKRPLVWSGGFGQRRTFWKSRLPDQTNVVFNGIITDNGVVGKISNRDGGASS